MAAAWPSTLPQNPWPDFKDWREPSVATTAMGDGPPKVRLLGTAERKLCTTYMVFTAAQLVTFRAFWATINRGVDSFTWRDWITDEACNYRLLSYPTFSPLTPGDKDQRTYGATLALERVNA